MNYALHYERLIARARGRVLTGYRERHHVIPRCMGGTDDPGNLVDLTAEEHYVAHQLLVKMYPSHRGLAYAAMLMAQKAVNRRPYGWLRKRAAGNTISPEIRARIAAGMRGKRNTLGMRHSPETKAKMSQAARGHKRGEGRVVSPATRLKMSLSQIGRTLTLEHRTKLVTAHTGQKRSPESIEKSASFHRGRKRSAETRAKMSAMMMGKIKGKRQRTGDLA